MLEGKNHFEMTRFSVLERHTLQNLISFLRESANDALHIQSLRQGDAASGDALNWQDEQDTDREDKLSILRGYDTVFLVDDSESMLTAGRWELVKKILAHSTDISTNYDANGIDIRFFNHKAISADNIKDPVKARSIIQQVNPRGRTPTLGCLQQCLRGYMRQYGKKQDDWTFSKYNLIVLTDGEPDPSPEHPEDITDEEDAKSNTAVNRKIRKLIVKTATDLEEMGAPDEQIGIQFCQIGNDIGVAKFLDYLDNDLRTKYRVRDVWRKIILIMLVEC